MANEKEITYSTVTEINITKALSASANSVSAKLRGQKQDSVVWDQTVCEIMEAADLSALSRDTSKEGIAEIGKYLKDVMAKIILSRESIPEKDKDCKGKEFTVCDKSTGMPKWSSWHKTVRIWDYLGSVAKVIAYRQESLLYPEKGKVAARCDILARCKTEETPMKAVERLCGDLQKALDKVPENERLISHNHIHGLNAGVSALRRGLSAVDTLVAVFGTLNEKESEVLMETLSRGLDELGL